MVLARIFTALCLVSNFAVAKEGRKIVAVVDTGLNITPKLKKSMCQDLNMDFTKTGLTDRHGHGTNVVGIILKKLNPETHCIAVVKYWDTAEKPEGRNLTYNIMRSVNNYLKMVRPAYVNISSSGGPFDFEEYTVLGDLLDEGTKVIVAAGNKGLNLTENACYIYPACYYFDSPNFYVVGSFSKSSNFNGPVKYKRDGLNQCGFGVCFTGTSQSAANMTAELISTEGKKK